MFESLNPKMKEPPGHRAARDCVALGRCAPSEFTAETTLEARAVVDVHLPAQLAASLVEIEKGLGGAGFHHALIGVEW